jgi:hypothetical protein
MDILAQLTFPHPPGMMAALSNFISAVVASVICLSPARNPDIRVTSEEKDQT